MSKSFGYFCSFPSPENGSQESPNVKLRGIISPSTIFVTTQILRAFPPLYARSECIIICYKWPVFAIEALHLTVDCDRNAHFAHWADGNAPTQLVSL